MIWIIIPSFAGLLAYYIVMAVSNPARQRTLLQIMRWSVVISGGLLAVALGLELALVDEYRPDVRVVHSSFGMVWSFGGLFYWVAKGTLDAKDERSRDAATGEFPPPPKE